MPYTKEFRKLLENTEETYLNKPVKKEYQYKYGKTYDKNEVKSVSYAIAKSRGIRIEQVKRRKK